MKKILYAFFDDLYLTFAKYPEVESVGGERTWVASSSRGRNFYASCLNLVVKLLFPRMRRLSIFTHEKIRSIVLGVNWLFAATLQNLCGSKHWSHSVSTRQMSVFDWWHEKDLKPRRKKKETGDAQYKQVVSLETKCSVGKKNNNKNNKRIVKRKRLRKVVVLLTSKCDYMLLMKEVTILYVCRTVLFVLPQRYFTINASPSDRHRCIYFVESVNTLVTHLMFLSKVSSRIRFRSPMGTYLTGEMSTNQSLFGRIWICSCSTPYCWFILNVISVCLLF